MWDCGSNIRISRQTNADNLGDLLEERTHAILVNVEGKVADEKSVGLGANAIAVLLGAVSSASLRVGVGRLGGSEVKVESSVVQELAIHGLVGLGGALEVGEVDVAEALAATSLAIVDNTGTGDALKVLEGVVQDVIIDTPAQASSEKGSGLLSSLCLALLGSGVNVLVSLALLGGGSGGLSLVRLGGVVGVITAVGIVRVLVRRFLL